MIRAFENDFDDNLANRLCILLIFLRCQMAFHEHESNLFCFVSWQVVAGELLKLKLIVGYEDPNTKKQVKDCLCYIYLKKLN